jgi:dsDNA-binding SOS-regulon protein
MTNKYVDHYTEQDNEGNITFTDKKLTLTSDGMIALTDNLEEIINKLTDSDKWQENKDFWHTRSEIRFDLMDLIHDIVNNKED